MNKPMSTFWENMHDERIRVAEAMRSRGGSFVQALGNALMCADSANVEKIRQAWPELWREYATEAARRKR